MDLRLAANGHAANVVNQSFFLVGTSQPLYTLPLSLRNRFTCMPLNTVFP